MKTLILGDVVGRPGRDILKVVLGGVIEREGFDFVIVNGENAAAGSGITKRLTEELLGCGIDVITTGDHVWKKRDVLEYLDEQACLLRPANYPDDTHGQGHVVVSSRTGLSVGVINLIGRVFMNPVDCPFRKADRLVKQLQKETNMIFVDFHTEATSEKIAMGWYLDGQVSCMFGTHTHVPTADERILPKGTAYITDVGMTGPYDSVIGRDKEKVIKTFLSRQPERFDVAVHDVRASGISVEVDEKTGKATEIKRVVYQLEGKEEHV